MDPEFKYVLIFHWKDGSTSTASTRNRPENPERPITTLSDGRIHSLIIDYPDITNVILNEKRELDHVEIIQDPDQG